MYPPAPCQRSHDVSMCDDVIGANEGNPMQDGSDKSRSYECTDRHFHRNYTGPATFSSM